jgi:GT2 family glycosyltransferase
VSGLHVIVPVKDQVEHTRRIVGQCADWPTLVIDNGSGPDTVGFLASQSTADVYRMPGAGIHEMWNTGIDWSLHRGADVVAILNNDLDFEPGAIEATARAVSNIGDLVVACPNYDDRAGAGVQRVESICANRYDGTGGIAGFAIFVDADLFRHGYRFPPELTWWYGDNDLVSTVVHRSTGWCGVVLDAHVIHLDGGGATGDWESPEILDVVARDAAIYQSKWGQRA